MRDEASAVLALKNAWNGAIQASEELSRLQPAVAALSDGARVTELDLETYHRTALAHANAAQALRGVIEQLQRLREREAAS